MTDLRKAAEQALEALDDITFGKVSKFSDARKALRQALAQPEQVLTARVVVTGREQEAFNLDRGCWERGCMAYDTTDCAEGTTIYVAPINTSQERVDETAKREHEPIGYINGVHGGYMVFTPSNPSAVYLNGTALFLAPPKKEWVGLTDADKQEAFDETQEASGGFWEFADYLEAKLKEKNG